MRVFGCNAHLKRWAITLLAVGASVTVAAGACVAGASASSGQAVKARAAKKHVNVAFIYADNTQDAMQEMALGAAAAAKHLSTNVGFSETGTDGVNGPEEVENFNAAEKTAPDGIAMETLTPTDFTRPLQQATSQKIPVIAVDTAPPAGSGVSLFVGNSNTDLGEKLATSMLPYIKNKPGVILIGQDIPGLPVLAQRIQGMIDILKVKRPKATIVQFDSQQTTAANNAAWAAELKKYPHPLGCLAPGNTDAISISLVEQHTGARYPVGQADVAPQALQGIKEGLVTLVVSPEHWLKGYIAEALLIKHAQTGAPLPKGWWNPGLLLVNKQNINAIIARQRNANTRYAWFKTEANYELAHPSLYLKPLSQAN